MKDVLGRGDMMVLRRAPRGGTVWCHEGLAWVTLRGDRTDHVLEPGECLVLGSNARVVVTGWDVGTIVEIASPTGGRVRTRRVAAAARPAPTAHPGVGMWSGLQGWAEAVGERL